MRYGETPADMVFAAFAPSYYPNASGAAQATPLVVQPGEDGRADFTLSRVPGVNVTVKYIATDGMSGTIGLTMDGIGDSPGFQRQEGIRGGSSTHIFSAVPPGRYIVRISGSAGNTSYSGRQVVDVHGADVGTELSARPHPVVSGTVELKYQGTKRRGSLLASLVPEAGAGGISTIVRSDGSFTFPGVAPGRWRPMVRGTDGFFASEVHVEGADFRDGIVDLEEGQSVTLKMVASDEIGSVKGFVDFGGQPVEGVMALLTPADLPSDPSRYAAYQTDSDGSFEWPDVRAGDYYLFAVDDTTMEYSNPAVLKPYVAAARRIHVDPHGSVSERIALAKPAHGK
jgi:hypothetical protein